MAEEEVRLDKWLWAARFFKTRALARAAVEAGHVQMNGARARPGKAVRSGQALHIRRGEEVFEVTVLAVSDKRGPAPRARLLYEEHPDSVARREEYARQRRLRAQGEPQLPRRPDKKQRRLLRQLKGAPR